MRFLYILLFIIMVIFMPVSSQARVLTLAYVDFPPYEYKKNGKPHGVLINIVKDIFSRADIPVKLVYYPFKRALQEVKSGNVDGIFNFYKTKERLESFDYSEAIITNPLVMFVRKDSNLSFSGKLADLNGKRIGAMLGYTYGNGFDDSVGFTIDRANSHEANLEKVSLGRIDAYLCDRLVGLYVLQKEKLVGKIKMLPAPLKVMNGYIGFTKGVHQNTISRINRVVRRMKKKKEITNIIDRYIHALARWLHCPECAVKFTY